MDLEQALGVLARTMRADRGRFYGAALGLALGKGLIYSAIAFPAYDDANGLYATLEGEILVLTHECDVEPANEKLFNEYVLICPIIKVEALVEQLDAEGDSEEYKRAFLGNLAARNIPRLIYLPPCDALTNGGAVYLNQITHSHVSAFQQPGIQPSSALSIFGLRDVEYALENHLLRPKADRLALAPE